ncbi:MAG: glycosyltransferase, partial [Fermentimonas sp.]
MSKIYQLISSIQLGGAELVAVNLASYCGELLGDGVEFHLVELYPTNNKYALTKKEELSSKNVRVITLFNGPKRLSLLLAPIKLIRFIQKEKPFVIHSHTDLPDFVLSVTIRILNFFKLYIPNVVRTIHNTQLWRSHHVMGKITESAYKNEIVVAVSSYSMEAYGQLRKKYKLQVSNDRQIIYNGCLVPSRNPHSFKTDKEKINIAFCGRFEDYKGMETLISTI